MLLASVPHIEHPCSSMAALRPDTIKCEGVGTSRKASCMFLLLGSPLLALQDTEVESKLLGYQQFPLWCIIDFAAALL